MERIIRLAHGAGGRMMADLIREVFAAALDNPYLRQMADASVLDLAFIADRGSPIADRLSPIADRASSIADWPLGNDPRFAIDDLRCAIRDLQSAICNLQFAISTDSFVVRPLFFPGGDIGSLAVHGTVNDVAMSGARPLWLTAGFILEEGLEIAVLEQVVRSMADAAQAAGVLVVAGDTKVVERGRGDGIYINTTGIGLRFDGVAIGPDRARPGDAVLLSGTVGDHGIAVLSQREGLGFETDLCSDSAPLNGLVEALLAAAPHTHCLRDPTRGGLAAALNELAVASGVGIEIEERAVPMRPAVTAACEMLGFDPLTVVNEGKLVAFVPAEEADAALAALRAHPLGREAARIGLATAEHPGLVLARTGIGGRRVVDMPLGELLPRIC